MNKLLITAAFLAFAGGLVHTVLGERLFRQLIFGLDFPSILGSERFVHRTLHFSWHLCTVAWWSLAGLLFALAGREIDATAVLVIHSTALLFLLSSVVTVWLSRARHPAWVLFLVIAALEWLAIGGA